MKRSSKRIFFLFIIFSITLIGLLFNCYSNNVNKLSYLNSNNLLSSSKDVIYMSDLDYITDNNWSYNGWSNHYIQKDRNPEGNTISLLVNSKKKVYVKGMGVHANGQITYDISSFSSTYTRFISRVGVDASRNTNGSILFKFFVSNDGKYFKQLLYTDVLKGDSESYYVDLDVSNYKYFRIFVDQSYNGNAADHGVIAPGKFVKTDYVDSSENSYSNLKDISYYDDILSKKDYAYNLSNNFDLILKRELVRKLDYNTIQSLVDYDPSYALFFDWIISDEQRQRQIIEVGEFESLPFLMTFYDLYMHNKDILSSSDKDIYQKMMIALSAGYSKDKVASALDFAHRKASYDYLERFTIFKKLYDDNSMTIYKNYFKNYHVELLRAVLSDGARNDEIKWLNYYTRKKNNNPSVYAYVNHIGIGTSYSDEIYHNIKYKDEMDKKYNLTSNGVTFGDGIQRYWMVIDKGGICWNQSRVFKSLYGSIGSPTIGVYQPGHEAVLYYIANNDGTGSWNMANKIFAWGETGTTWYGDKAYRTIFNWANKPFTNKHVNNTNIPNSGAYIYLAQDNLNNYSKYKKSLYLNLLANSYSNANIKINIYNKSIEENSINLDTYDYLIKEYKNNNATPDDWYKLSLKIINNYTYYPMAMNDLLKLTKPFLVNEKNLDIDTKENNALIKASNANSSVISNVSACKEVAKVLLGNRDSKVATFSFDKENKNKIVLNDKYKDYDLSWRFSIDGGITKSSPILDKSYLLSDEMVSKINDTNDILIYVDGLDPNTPLYKIDIIKRKSPSDVIYNNDLENKVIGADSSMEWKIKDSNTWTGFDTKLPDLSSNTTVYVRYKASANSLASDYVSLDYTLDVIDLTKKYVPISYLSIHDVSSEATNNNGFAKYSIDGNYNTRWHSAWNGTDEKRFITIKFSTPIHLSLIEYVPAGGGNGKIIDASLKGSTDGNEWFNIGSVSGLKYTSNVNDKDHGKQNIKRFTTNSNKEISYVKITATKASNGNWFTARMFNFYQDSTKSKLPSAGVSCNINTLTNKDVLCKLVDYDQDKIEVLTSTSHLFKENGQYSFIIKDKFTYNKNEIIAKVDWIDKNTPVGVIKYNINKKTNKDVIASLTTNKKVTILNDKGLSVKNGKVINSIGEEVKGYIVDKNNDVYDLKGNYIMSIDPFKHVFVENGSYTFKYVDEAGNIGSSTAKVDWIDKKGPLGILNYNIKNKTDKNVTVKISFDKKKVTILNNNGKDYYTFTKNGNFTFKYVDEAGNIGSSTAKVDWINKKNSNNKPIKEDKTPIKEDKKDPIKEDKEPIKEDKKDPIKEDKTPIKDNNFINNNKKDDSVLFNVISYLFGILSLIVFITVIVITTKKNKKQ